MSTSMDQTILKIEDDIMKGRMRKLGVDGLLYDDKEDYNFPQDVDENDEHRLVLSDVI